ncbi:Uu.00g088620.m01.CDS01 [Anthostomella pinea]|uniref:Uu.00g088620.m01.CDS01 n=1 Tax=Anthostomella pinea TaxID=933095 RepID=A0AAI8VNH1_9PEZI|nr:Uu.00g088620.m01.CDS01 [Anthostomella pinea]
MDARPSRPACPLPGLGNENRVLPAPKAIHQRHKSTGTLVNMSTTGGLNVAAKRTALGDRNGVPKPSAGTTQNGPHPTTKNNGTSSTMTIVKAQESQSQAPSFLRPAQRPLSKTVAPSASMSQLRSYPDGTQSSQYNVRRDSASSKYVYNDSHPVKVQEHFFACEPKQREAFTATANGYSDVQAWQPANDQKRVDLAKPAEAQNTYRHLNPVLAAWAMTRDSLNNEQSHQPPSTNQQYHEDCKSEIEEPEEDSGPETWTPDDPEQRAAYRRAQEYLDHKPTHAFTRPKLPEIIEQSHPPSSYHAEDDGNDLPYLDAVEEIVEEMPHKEIQYPVWGPNEGPLIPVASLPDPPVHAAKTTTKVDVKMAGPQPSHPAPAVVDEHPELSDYDDDDYYEDPGVMTDHSLRFRGENTTGGATTVMFPKFKAQDEIEIETAKEIVESKRTDEEVQEDAWDVSMVAEYGDEIFQYMKELEMNLLPNAHYMDIQTEIQWSMRSVLMDWVVQVHTRFGLLPETLFLTVNFIDRFLSYKIVSLGKLQLVGATAIFVAAKYEEINCPSVQEIIYMVDGGYTVDEILKAERFMLTMLNFELGWPGPMSFLRRISKADDYDLEARTVAKYFIEMTIMDERFVPSPPSYVAAGSHCLSRLVLGKGDWTPEHVYYSGYTFNQLKPLVAMMLDCCRIARKHHGAIFEKYSDKRYKRASAYVETQLAKGFSLNFAHPVAYNIPVDWFKPAQQPYSAPQGLKMPIPIQG